MQDMQKKETCVSDEMNSRKLLAQLKVIAYICSADLTLKCFL